ncbi:tRNA 2-thiouridine(34) synthase MnmA [bacterium]|nr:tRNA 2-thiouridine(34) synthase MnmA [bacterium]MBU1024802.1 tRNA 2-thiouridine(34) synthase MnmA [bacterium]
MKSVAVAMSGGVDSSVAALILKREGYEVIGVHLKLFDAEDENVGARTCCSVESAELARAVCDKIDADFYVLNYRDKFEKDVIRPFALSYLEGRTPNPCVACNMYIKFESLLKQIQAIGVDSLATGHYIRSVWEDDRWKLLRGIDNTKDQSYFLYMLTQKMLGSTLFPNGIYQKSEIRKMALDADLPVADQPESQEICFVLSESYAENIDSMYPGKIQEGEIVDRSGKVLGKHRGIAYYTIGQRRGLGISAPEPFYVVEIKPDENIVVIGYKEEILSGGLIFNEESFVSGEPPCVDDTIMVQIRYNVDPVKAEFSGKVSEGYKIVFSTPQSAVTSGQAVVLYRGDEVLGGGTIVKSAEI